MNFINELILIIIIMTILLKETVFHFFMLICNIYTYYYKYIPTLQFIIISELLYYLSDLRFKIKNKQYDFIFHHVVSLVAIPTAYYFQYYDYIIHCLLILSISTPFLSLTKLLKHIDYNNSAKTSFIIFSTLFFLTRICYSLYLLHITFFIIENNFIRSTACMLYLLQIYWFYVIISVFQILD